MPKRYRIFLLVMPLLTLSLCCASSLNSADSCVPNCACQDTKITCKGVIPYTVSENVTTVYLTLLKQAEFSPSRFCHISWKYVTELIIESVLSKKLAYFHLVGNVFDCLSQIESFRFSSGILKSFAENAFSGLTNLSTLDLSNCKVVLWEDIVNMLSVPSNLPQLKRLILSGTGVFKPLFLDDDFARALSLRPIAYLDLSFTLLVWSFSDPGKLCDTLLHLKYEGAQVLHSKIFRKCKVCKSLQIVDDSHDKFYETLFHNLTCKNAIQYFSNVSPFFRNMRVLYFNNIVTSPEMYPVNNCFWVLWPGTELRELHFAHNHFPNFDVKLYNILLDTLDLKHNKMERINPGAFKYLPSLQTLDLSNNHFQTSQGTSDTFSVLFSHNENLTVVDLSANRLASLPKTTFTANTNLRRLLLSDNLFDQLTFEVSHLVDLSVLDLSRNAIKFFDQVSRNSFDELYKRQVENHTGMYVQVLLDGNPFSCSCDAVAFLQWFVSSPLLTVTRSKCFCLSNNLNITMGEDAIQAAKDDCERIKRRHMMILVLSTTIPTAMIFLVLTSVMIHKRCRKRRLNRLFQDGIKRLRKNTDRFPVFLSYSSDDNELVKRQLLLPLQSRLETMTELSRELVCNADVHFHPARTILSEMFRCLKQCDVFVAVISKSYCKSKFCRYEIEHAHLLEKPIILIFIEHVPKEEMDPITREVFEKFTRVQLVLDNGEYTLQPGWQQLCESIIQHGYRCMPEISKTSDLKPVSQSLDQ